MIFYDCIQNTPEWLELRGGHFTASAANDLFLKPETAGYQNCISRVLFERKTGKLLNEKKYSNEAISNGHTREPLAIEQYEMITFTKVKNGGFCEFGTIEDELHSWIGCSPDGFVEEDGQIQVKCPEFATIKRYIETGKLPLNYARQMQFELMITGRLWNDFFVYYPEIQPFTIRVNRDEEMIKEIESKLNLAIAEVKEFLPKIELAA
jgi:hypothetical protein